MAASIFPWWLLVPGVRQADSPADLSPDSGAGHPVTALDGRRGQDSAVTSASWALALMAGLSLVVAAGDASLAVFCLARPPALSLAFLSPAGGVEVDFSPENLPLALTATLRLWFARPLANPRSGKVALDCQVDSRRPLGGGGAVLRQTERPGFVAGAGLCGLLFAISQAVQT